MPLTPGYGNAIIGGAHPKNYPCVLRIIVIKRLVRFVLRLFVEKFAEKFDDVLASGVGRLSIIGDRVGVLRS
jgi:hypothetical protein